MANRYVLLVITHSENTGLCHGAKLSWHAIHGFNKCQDFLNRLLVKLFVMSQNSALWKTDIENNRFFNKGTKGCSTPKFVKNVH